jgi:hypothetical protein
MLFCPLLFSGCATLGPQFQKVETIPEGVGLVYIYRPDSFFGAGVAYDVKVGDTVVTELPNGGYFSYFSQPGEVEFWAKTESKSAVTLDVKANQIYYIKGTIGVGFFVGRPHLMIVTPEVGEKEISECKSIIPRKE